MQNPSVINLTVFIHVGNQYTFNHQHWVEEITNELMKGDANNTDMIWDDLYEDLVSDDILQVKVEPSTTIHQLLVAAARYRKLHQAYPATVIQLVSGELLWDETKTDETLDAIGIADGDLILMTYRHDDNSRLLLRSSPNATSLFTSIRGDSQRSIAPKEFSSKLTGVLLYTDDDREIAQFVRSHFFALHYMSGELLQIYLIEEPPARWRNAMEYWRVSLSKRLFRTWSLLGWLSTKPYDKNQAYEIGRTLGVLPDQLPCLILFDSLARNPKLVFPILSTSIDYFRRLFSSIERSFYQEGKLISSFENLKKQYSAIIKNLNNAKPEKVAIDRTEYNFYGQTVFINHPKGQVNLSDFQKK